MKITIDGSVEEIGALWSEAQARRQGTLFGEDMDKVVTGLGCLTDLIQRGVLQCTLFRKEQQDDQRDGQSPTENNSPPYCGEEGLIDASGIHEEGHKF